MATSSKLKLLTTEIIIQDSNKSVIIIKRNPPSRWSQLCRIICATFACIWSQSSTCDTSHRRSSNAKCTQKSSSRTTSRCSWSLSWSARVIRRLASSNRASTRSASRSRSRKVWRLSIFWHACWKDSWPFAPTNSRFSGERSLMKATTSPFWSVQTTYWSTGRRSWSTSFSSSLLALTKRSTSSNWMSLTQHVSLRTSSRTLAQITISPSDEDDDQMKRIVSRNPQQGASIITTSHQNWEHIAISILMSLLRKYLSRYLQTIILSL